MSDTTKQAPSPADVASLARPRPAAEAKPVEPSGRHAGPSRSPARRRWSSRSRPSACDTVFGIPGGAILPGLRPAARLDQGAPHPRAPRAGRRPRGRGLRRGDRQGRRLHGDVGPGRDQPRHPARRRATWTPCPIVAITGQVVERGHRHRRLPGGRHPGHHDADHEAQLPRDRRRRRSRGRSPRRSTSPRTGRPGPVLVDISKDALQATTTFSWPPQIDLPGYRPVTRPHGKQIREAARLIAAAKQPDPLRRRRRHPRPAPARSCGSSSSSPASPSSPR